MAADFNLYTEHPSVAGMPESAANDWRSQHRVQVSGSQPVPNPVRTFLEASFPEFIMAGLEASGFERPTPIQSQSWPIALSGRDVIGLAATGSGKTLCFALPMIVHINSQPHLQPGDGPIALVLSPTRELALQTKGECDRFGASSGVTNTAIYGGVPKGPQQRDLQHGVEIVIATPGRLIDFMDVRAPRAALSRPPRQPASARIFPPLLAPASVTHPSGAPLFADRTTPPPHPHPFTSPTPAWRRHSFSFAPFSSSTRPTACWI
jgi:hypothetical protein